MVKIILALLALAVCAEATFDVLLLNLLKHKAPKPHYPPPPPPPPRPLVYYHPVPQVRYVYVYRTAPVAPSVASYYRHPVSTPVDIPQAPTVSQATATATAVSDSVVIEGKQEPLSFTEIGNRQAPEQAAAPIQQTLSLPFAQSGPAFSVETVKSESHSFDLQPEVNGLDQNQTGDTIEVQPEEDEEEE